MAGLVEYLTRIQHTCQYRLVDRCLQNKAFEVCISLLTGYMTLEILCYDQKYLLCTVKKKKKSTESVAMPL
jgi:hypothetical protein